MLPLGSNIKMIDLSSVKGIAPLIAVPRKPLPTAGTIHNVDSRELVTEAFSTAGLIEWRAPDRTLQLETLTLVGGTGRDAGTSEAWYYIRIVDGNGNTSYDWTYRTGYAPADYCTMSSSSPGQTCYYHQQQYPQSWDYEIGGTTFAFGYTAYGGYGSGGQTINAADVSINPGQTYNLEIASGANSSGYVRITYYK